MLHNVTRPNSVTLCNISSNGLWSWLRGSMLHNSNVTLKGVLRRIPEMHLLTDEIIADHPRSTPQTATHPTPSGCPLHLNSGWFTASDMEAPCLLGVMYVLLRPLL